jgi:hypothetical protein
MGNLAERYRDPKRSGVYRVSSAEVPVLAAREACADLRECDAADLEPELGRAMLQLADRAQGRPCILLVRQAAGGRACIFQQQPDLMVRLLNRFRKISPQADPCFVVLVDPLKVLDLPNIWREPASRLTGV